MNSTAELIDAMRGGEMVVLLDDESRENEGDVVVAAELATPEHINFMAHEACGLICLTLTEKRCRQLGLAPMVADNRAKTRTNFTASIDAAGGITTGISARDRAATIAAAVAENAGPDDVVQPGHVFPLRAAPGGVLTRAGHTEAGCDLARLAGLEPAAVIVEILKKDGTMARRADLAAFAKTHGLKIGTIADLIHHRVLNERTVRILDTGKVANEWGEFVLHRFRDTVYGHTHLALVHGELRREKAVPVRVHVPNLLRDMIGAEDASTSGWTMRRVFEYITTQPSGVLILLGSPPSDPSAPAVDSTAMVGIGAQILSEIGVGKMTVLSKPAHYVVSGFGLEVVEYVSWYEIHGKGTP